jgi:hypothetical protein
VNPNVCGVETNPPSLVPGRPNDRKCFWIEAGPFDQVTMLNGKCVRISGIENGRKRNMSVVPGLSARGGERDLNDDLIRAKSDALATNRDLGGLVGKRHPVKQKGHGRILNLASD